jgi:hypothetical protein
MTITPRSRLAALASAGVLTLGGLTVVACGSDDAEESPATTECVPTDTSTPGERGSSNTTVVGDSPGGEEGGSAGATEGDQREGSNSGAGDAPDRSTPDADQDGNTTGNADTGSGGSTRTC